MKTLTITIAFILITIASFGQQIKITTVSVECNTTGYSIIFNKSQSNIVRKYVAQGFRISKTKKVSNSLSGNNLIIILVKNK